MSDSVEYAILTESLTKIYHHKHIALNCVDLAVEPGTVLGVLGPNGAGKTTLVRLLLGLHVPTAGRIFVLGKQMTPNAALLRQRIGYMPADPKFPAGMSPIRYLEYVGRLGGLTRKERRPRLAALLRAVDLLAASGRPIAQLSTGMRTRLAIAASLINDPELLVWDEPAQGLDPEARLSMLRLMQSLAESKTLLLCTHNLADISQVANQAIVMHQGQIIFNGDLEELSGKVKPSSLEMTLVGDRKAITEVAKAIQGFEGVESCALNKNLLSLRIDPGYSHASVLANILITLADRQLEMGGLEVSGGATEQAIADLMSQEDSRGLTRAHQVEAE